MAVLSSIHTAPISDQVKVDGCTVNAVIDPSAAVSVVSPDFVMTLTDKGAMLKQGANSLLSLSMVSVNV